MTAQGEAAEDETDRRIRDAADLDSLAFHPETGLITVVAQDAASGAVLMVAWANREALEATLATGEMHYWSRSREELWRKGATSGNVQRVLSLHADCDGDTVLARVEPAGPACHTGDRSCFGRASAPEPHIVTELWSLLEERNRARPEGSYTTKLLFDENLRLKKLGEEGAELLTALARRDGERIPEEAGDLLYHLLVALMGAETSLEDVESVLRARRR